MSNDKNWQVRNKQQQQKIKKVKNREKNIEQTIYARQFKTNKATFSKAKNCIDTQQKNADKRSHCSDIKRRKNKGA